MNDTQRKFTNVQIGLVVAAVLLLFFIFRLLPTSKVVTTDEESLLPGMQISLVPWGVETAYLRERLSRIGLPALATEGNALHIHQHIDIFIHGKQVGIPAEIGVNEQAGFISPIHTHDTSGVIHIESPIVQDFNLGQFFDIWGVGLTKQSIGGYVNTTTSTLRVFVNGVEVMNDPRSLLLTAHQEIVLTYGEVSELPKRIPAEYGFEKDL
ncbi:hypothetical protein EPO17_02375 [Patescibacteria group bacterium]|nr:MAG: hypothetical protein EPO17_02375 [Patescibacteria group bacterium]